LIVSQPREMLWAWMNQRVPTLPWSEDFRAIGLVRDDCLVAVAGYNAFCGRTCNMHAAVDDASKITREFVRAAFSYAFEELGLVAVLAWMDSSKEKSLLIDLKAGFSKVYSIPGATLNGDELVLIQMNRGDCRWLRKGLKNEQPRHSPNT